MIIVKGYPPNIKEIREVFNLNGRNPVFTYGDRIYNPNGWEMPKHLIVHEKTHIKQQSNYSNSDEWWKKYLSDPQFRLDQEIEAYRNQFKFYKTIDKGWMRFLKRIAFDLSDKMYGNIISYQEAINIILK